MAKKLVELYPEVNLPLWLDETRSTLRRGLVTTAEDEARIDACTDLATLDRRIVEAVTASDAGEALR